DDLQRPLLEKIERRFHVLDVGVHNALRRAPVSARENELLAVERDDGIDVAAVAQELRDCVALLERVAGVQLGIPEVAELFSPSGEPLPKWRLAADNVLLELRDCQSVQIGMRVGVVAELVARVEPCVEHLLELAAMARVDEAERRRVMLL